jgi:hypothetical protein
MAMIGANLVMLAVLGQALPTNPTDLVARLGSARYAEREAAAEALERLGRQALPALRAAHDARDAEVRSRASALITRVENALLTRPTLVALDFDDRPLKEVVREVGERSGIELALTPEGNAVFEGRRVTLREPAPLPFWKAIDRICDVGQVQYSFMNLHQTGREPSFNLTAYGQRPAGPSWDTGPFRVILIGVHYQRDVLFGGRPANPIRRPGLPPPPPVPAPEGPQRPAVVSEQFYAQLQVVAEPRLSLSQVGPPRIVEAVDDRDQTLLIPSSGSPVVQRSAGYFGLGGSPALQMIAPLKRPEQPGKAIKKLRGTIPVIVSTRKPDPLVVPLAGAAGKTFQNDDVVIAVQEVQADPNAHQASIVLSVRPGKETGGIAPVGPNGEFIPHRPDMNQLQIVVADAQGRTMSWFPSNYDAEGSRVTLSLRNPAAPPAELRYHAIARAEAEVDFQFTDVPLP